jgi:hydroxymethylbilane synthase
VTTDEIAIGSRGSALALAQAKLAVEAFEEAGQPTRIVVIETAGDRRSPDTAWGEGAFVAALERALLDGRVDVAVHSAKDVPTDEDPRLAIGAYLPRADARDALVVRAGTEARGVDALPHGSRIGTDSPRRTGFLLARRPDFVLHPLHGNVDTRLRRLDSGETDALVLACAGLDRLGLGNRISERLEAEIVPPAPGQGAIAIQIRRDDAPLARVASAIDHRPTRIAVEAERAFLAASGGGCRAPIGALAEIEDEALVMVGGYAHPDGSATAIGRRRGSVADGSAIGRELALELESQLRRQEPSKVRNNRQAPRPRVIVTRAVEQADDLLAALRTAGINGVPVPAIAVEFEEMKADVDVAVRGLPAHAWVVVTSANGARSIVKAAERTSTDPGAASWAAVGPATRRFLEQAGIAVAFQPRQSSAAAMALELPIVAGQRVLVIRGDLANEDTAFALRSRGAEVNDLVAYRTSEAPESSRGMLRRALSQGPVAGVVFTSGSTVRGLVALARSESLNVLSVPAVCIGPATADEARAAGFTVLATSPTAEPAALAAATSRALALQPQEIR